MGHPNHPVRDLARSLSRRRFPRLVLGLILLVLAACQGRVGHGVVAEALGETVEATTHVPATATIPGSMGVPPTATATVTPTPTPSPTLTPTPTATATPFVCPHLQGRTEAASLQSAAMGELVRYVVHLPPCYDMYPDRAYPVLYLFHGWPMDEWHWSRLGMIMWADDWVSRGLVGPFLLVMPGVDQDGRYVHSSGGDSSFEGFVVQELVPQIDQLYRTVRSPEGRGVGGISRGGVWSLEIGMRNQDLFGIVGGHSPALALNRPLPQYDPYRLAREGVSGLRIYLDAGDGDWARTDAMRLRDLLLELEADVTYDLHPGGHVDELWSGAVPDYLAFYTATWPRTYETLPVWLEPPPPPDDGAAP